MTSHSRAVVSPLGSGSLKFNLLLGGNPVYRPYGYWVTHISQKCEILKFEKLKIEN